MNELLREPFRKALQATHRFYDDKEGLLLKPLVSPGYHTNIHQGTVHPTRESLDYAVALLDDGNEAYAGRAIRIIDTVLGLQDDDPASATFGVWPWYAEEPLGSMSAPDYNWADFLGKALLYVLIAHPQRLPAALREKVKEAALRAALCIRRHNIGPDYTNISLMGGFVCVKAGELLRDDDLLAYGNERLAKALRYADYHGGFTEYNSPAYSLVALEEIGRMLRLIDDPGMVRIAQRLNEWAWRSLSLHYHPPTGQLSGPHARCYGTLQGKLLQTFIYAGVQGAVPLIAPSELTLGEPSYRNPLATHFEWVYIAIDCPEPYRGGFKPLAPGEERWVRDCYFKGDDPIIGDDARVLVAHPELPALEARTYMNGSFTLGSFTKCDLWNQRRPLLAYWSNAGRTAYIRLQCLKNGYDFSSCVATVAQHRHAAVAGLQFVADYGDSHIVLDPVRDGVVELDDLRLRFELGGHLDGLLLPERLERNEPWVIASNSNSDSASGGVDIRISLLHASFENEPVRCELRREEDLVWIDVILYSGGTRMWNVAETSALVLLGIDLRSGDDAQERPTYGWQAEENGVRAYIVIAQEEVGAIELRQGPASYVEAMKGNTVK